MSLVTNTVNFGVAPGSDYVETSVAGFSGLTSANYAGAFTDRRDAEDRPRVGISIIECYLLSLQYIRDRLTSERRCGRICPNTRHRGNAEWRLPRGRRCGLVRPQRA
jgi:hypothetical protein